MAAQGACPPAGTRLTGTLGTTATAAGAAARDHTAQDPGELELGCQGLQSREKLLKYGHLVCLPGESKPPGSGPAPAFSTHADWCWRSYWVPLAGRQLRPW